MISVGETLRRPVIAIAAAILMTALAAVAIATAHVDHSTGEWPMTCVDLNDIVEEHLGNPDNVGIYQTTFGDEAEAACQNDHRNDVTAVFGWAIAEEAGAPGTELELDWPTTCVELNDIVEGHLGNQRNVGIYQNTFGNQAEAACRNDHRDDVRSTFRWAIPSQPIPSPQSARREEAPPTLPWAVISELTWVADGVDGSEYVAVTTWNEIAASNWMLARQIAGYDWFVAGTDSNDWVSLEILALWKLAVIAEGFPALAELVSGYRWMADYLTQSEVAVLQWFTDIAEYDMELAIVAMEFPWIADDIRSTEAGSLHDLAFLAQFAPRLAWLAADLNATAPIADRNILLPKAFARISSDDRWGGQLNRLDRLTSKPWFLDGLDAEEVAFLVALPPPGRWFDELLERRYTQSKSISLPIKGEVNLWVFQRDPFPADDDLLTMTEQGVRGAEGLMGAPFPVTDVIVSVARDPEELFGFDGQFTGYIVNIVRSEKSRQRYVAYHEVAHFYFSGSIGPHWLSEGGADFTTAYTSDAFGFESLDESKRTSLDEIEERCIPHGITNLHQLALFHVREIIRCGYKMGEYFLISMFETLGEESVSSALRDFYWRDVHNPDERLREEVVYQVFLEHTPLGLEEQFRDLYRRLHGGPYVDAHS